MKTEKTKNKKMKITKKTKLGEIARKDDKAAEILMKEGMSCFGCPMAMEETLEDGCIAHGMTKEEIDKLLKKLNAHS